MMNARPPNGFLRLAAEPLQALLDAGFKRTLPAGGILFCQGDPARHAFWVHEGRLKLSQLNEAGKEVILRYIDPGEITAEVAVMKDRPYPATAEVMVAVRVTGWDKATLVGLMRRYPDIAIQVVETLLERIGELQDRYLELSTENVERRIGRTLLRLMRRAGVRTGDGIEIDMALGRQDIADYAGTTIFTVSRTLSAWEKKGWIQSGRERITISDPHALVLFSESG